MSIGKADQVMYHYTSGSNLNRIYQGDTRLLEASLTATQFDVENTKGLLPGHSVVNWRDNKTLPNLAYRGAVFGFLEPQPPTWKNHPAYGNVLDNLLGNIIPTYEGGIALLEIALTLNDDPFIFDWEPIERVRNYSPPKRKWFDIMPTNELSKEQLSFEACTKRWNSGVALSRYDGSYSLPELVVFSRVLPGQIKVLWIKPYNEVFDMIKAPDFEPATH